MPLHLDVSCGLPLEREHEAWLIRGIEEYAQALGLRCTTFAVSPKDEKTWPADEVLGFPSKFIGLQFKRPYPYPSSKSPHGVYWRIDCGSRQFADVCRTPHIFYALPTYLNRQIRRDALHHCLFWRPNEEYLHHDHDHEGERWPYCVNDPTQDDLWAPVRWGGLVEEMLACRAGARVESNVPISSVLGFIREAIRLRDRAETADVSEDEMAMLHAIFFELPGQKIVAA